MEKGYSEYDVALAIRKHVKTYIDDVLKLPYDIDKIGIWPVGDLKCNLSLKDLGPHAKDIISKCKNVFENNDFTRSSNIVFNDYPLGPAATAAVPVPLGLLQQNESYSQSHSPPKVKRLKRSMSLGISGGLSGGREGPLCAFNLPRYDFDLRRYLTNAINSRYFDISKMLVLKLKILHGAGVFHLDIKPDNIAMNLLPSQDGVPVFMSRFADWGFSFIASKAKISSLKRLVEFIFGNEYRYKLMVGHIYYKNKGSLPFTDAYNEVLDKKIVDLENHYNASPDELKTYTEFLRKYDMLCLLGGPIATLFKFAKISPLNFEKMIDESLLE